MNPNNAPPPADVGTSEQHEDDDVGSTVAVHVASPRPNMFSSRSAPDDVTDDDYPASDEEESTSLDPRGVTAIRKHTTANNPRCGDDDDKTNTGPAQLSLNKMNLKTFETSAKQGNIPLRSDMLGPRHTLPTKVTTASSSMFVNSGVDESLPARSIALPQSPVSHRERSHSQVPLDKMSVASIECEVGSTVPMRDGDDLNAENLREHLRELYSGQPLPLQAENIGGNRPQRRSPRSDRRDDMSVLVEPSEADAPSITSSALLPAEQLHRAGFGSVSHTRCGDVVMPPNPTVEDLWSLASTGDHEPSILSSFGPMSVCAGDNAGVYHNMLSTESLIQLRKQLESGDTPLRPEMLYGFIRAMGHGTQAPGVSPSMVVEAPIEDRGSFNAALRGGGGCSGVGGATRPRECGPVLSANVATDHETDRAERGSTSPPVLDTYNRDNGDDDDLEADVDGEGLQSRPQRRDVDNNSSVADHNESLILTDAENFTEDTDAGVTKDQVRELWRAIVELKNERRQLERRFAETSRKLDSMDAHSQRLITDTQLAISRKLDVAVQAIESRLVTQMQDAIRTLQAVVAPHPSTASTTESPHAAPPRSVDTASPATVPPSADSFSWNTGGGSTAVMESAPTMVPLPRASIRLLMQVAPSLSQSGCATTVKADGPLEFIVPVSPTATIGDCKAKFVSRLQQVSVLKTCVAPSEVALQYKGKHVFDEDSLADVIDAQASALGESGHAHLFVLVAVPTAE